MHVREVERPCATLGCTEKVAKVAHVIARMTHFAFESGIALGLPSLQAMYDPRRAPNGPEPAAYTAVAAVPAS